MPSPIVFAACEKVIISQDENNPTLIALLSEMGGSIEVKRQPAGLIQAPVRWQVFTMWAQDPGDEGKEFEQLVRFVSPSQKNHFNEEALAFSFKGRTHRIAATIPILPVGENGEWRLELYVRDKGADSWPGEPVRTYPLHLNFKLEILKSEEQALKSIQ